MLGRHRQLLPAPDALQTILTCLKPAPIEHGSDPPIAKPSILPGKREDALRARILIPSLDEVRAQGAPRLNQNPVGQAMRYAVVTHRMSDCPPALLGAQKFPSATSFRMAFSSDRSATMFLRLAFSHSRFFNQLT